MILEVLFVAVLPAIFITAAAWDLMTFTIPNVFAAALFILFIVFAIAMLFVPHGLTFTQFGLHAAAGAAGLAAGMLLFSLGWIGGGDAKLFAVACFWLGWGSLFQFAVYASLFGGVLTLGILLLRAVPIPARLIGHDWLVRLTDRRSGIPYGVALSAAALALWSGSDLFRLAAAIS